MACKIVPFGKDGVAIVCYKSGPKPKTWKCNDCGKRTPTAEDVCMHCGLYADGCPKCDSDMHPAKDKAGNDLHPFRRGVKRLHRCTKPDCAGALFR